MAWGKAGSTTTTSSASSMDSGTMSASKFNQILCHVSGLSASTFCETKFNSSTSGYDSVAKQNNGTDFPRLSQSDLNSLNLMVIRQELSLFHIFQIYQDKKN